MLSRFLTVSVFTAAFFLANLPRPGYAEAEEKSIVIAMAETLEPGLRDHLFVATGAVIRQALPGRNIAFETISAINAARDVKRLHPDFLILPSGLYLTLAQTNDLRLLATRKRSEAADPSRGVAAAFVVREDRTDLQSLADLEGVRIAAGTPYSVDGWLAALGEIQARGYDPEHFFSETIFLQFPFPDIVRSLMKGSADVGVIPACMLERLESVGALEKGLLRVVHEQTSPELACRRSSALYPDWVVASMGTASPEDVRQVSIGLLTMPNTNDFEWWAAGDFRALNELYRTLRLGPYAFLRDFSVHAVIERYKGPLLFAAALMVLFLLNELRVHVLVRRRTKELSDALMERDANAQSIRELQKQLGEVERVGAVSQLSSMIAHELKQPVASIINFSAALSVRLGGLLKAHPECAAGLCTIRAESERISEIISRVRQYAKHRPVSAAPCSLSAAVRKAVLVYRNGEGGRIPVEVTETENVWVVADELELELLVLNLIRNAAQAQTRAETPYIRIRIERSASEVQLTVEDNGPALSDAQFRKLSHAQTSMKPDGLGLGLEITRSIADEVFLASQKFFFETFFPEVRVWPCAERYLDEEDLSAPGCLILDYRMPDRSGLEVQRALLLRRKPLLPIIFLSAHGDIGTAVHAMRNGAVDFLEKPVEPEALLAKVRTAVAWSLDAFKREHDRRRMELQVLSLTGREREVIDLAVKGMQNKEIADLLGISVTTVKMYRANAFQKLGVNTILAASQFLARAENSLEQ